MKRNPAIQTGKLLRNAFIRKQRVKAGYSQASLARDLGVSSAFVTKLFTGKSFPPKETLSKLIYLLEFDSVERIHLIQSMTLERESSSGYRSLLKSSLSVAERSTPSRSALPTSPSFLEHWYNFAVLEALDTQVGLQGIDAITKTLGISKDQTVRAIDTLLRLEIIEQTTAGQYKKVTSHMYVPTARSKTEMRRFHVQMIDKARFELTHKPAQQDFERRLITGFTFSCNKDQVEKMKIQIQDFLSQLTASASEGETSEVYQVNVQLFPLSKIGDVL